MRIENTKSKRRRWFVVTVIGVVAYSAILGWFKFSEDSLVYLPRKGLRNADSINIGIEQVELRTSDNIKLMSWIVPSVDSSHIWFLYLQGNGGNISSRGYLAHFKEFQKMGINTFALGYRGYGASEGAPSEAGIYTDAITAFNYLTKERKVLPRNIMLFGYSLGTGVAIEVATRVDAGGVILEGAYTSLPDAGFTAYPFLPTSMMMKNRFDSASKIKMVAEPKLFLHSSDDEVIPFELGKNLFELAAEPKTFVTTIGGHEAAHTRDSAKFYNSIAQFLEQVARSSK